MTAPIVPPPLTPGSRIRVVAPAGPFEVSAFEAGVAALSASHSVIYEEEILSRDGYLAGSDQRRLAELQTALDDPECDAIIPVRGGYGTMRLLDQLDLDGFLARPKWLVGFSDLTALHACINRQAVVSIHGPMVAAFGRERLAGQSHSLERVEAVLRGGSPPSLRGRTMREGHARGRVIGGNLAVLAALLGTRFFPQVEDAILVLEDVGEAPYRVDRLLTSLRLAGVFDQVAAVVFGQFSRCLPGPDGTRVEDVLERAVANVSFPVLANISVGHDPENHPLLLGAEAEIRDEQLCYA